MLRKRDTGIIDLCAERTDRPRASGQNARLGTGLYRPMIARYGSAIAAIEALPERCRQRGIKLPRLPDIATVEREFERHAAFGAKIHFPGEPDYPKLLAALQPPPAILSVSSDQANGLFDRPAVAIVGSRNASAVGRRMARDLAAELAAAGHVVVSGLARGIDGEAHGASLSCGTIAVLAGGVDNIYPRQHEALYSTIRDQGALVSESPIGFEPRAKDFPRRNRIITGLALGVVVVEAAERSGSLISARCALEQGRDVFAVPGSPLDPRNKGSNRLIKQGAALVESVEDILSAIGALSSVTREAPSDWLGLETPDESVPEGDIDTLRAALSPTPASLADISAATGIPLAMCASALVELELMGLAETYPGGLAARKVSEKLHR